MITIPNLGKWVSSGLSNIFGSLWSSFNLDLNSNPGRTLISPRTIITTNDITDLGVPVAFQVFTDTNGGVQYAWAVAGGYVFRMSLANGFITAFAKDGSTGSPNNVCSSDVSDITFSGKDWLVVTSTDDVYRFNPSTSQWNDGANELGLGVHMICFYAGRFYVIASAGQKVYSFLPANYGALTTSSNNTFDLTGKGYNVSSLTFLKPSSNRIWLGSVNQSENGCYVFAWNGVDTTINEFYIIPDAFGVLAGVIKNDVPWVIDSNARLMVFNGGTFTLAPNGQLPMKNAKLLKNSASAINDRWIHPNGMQIVNGRINILINNEYRDNGATIEENIASGIWEYDPEIGWYHKMSLSLYVSSITDYAQNRVSRVGAIYANKDDTTASTANGTMLIGAQVYTNASSTAENIYIDDTNDTIQKSGYFVTTWIDSQNVQDIWQKLFVIYRQLLSSTDKIILKYRTTEASPIEASITWVNTTSFTTTTDVSGREGQEVEILQGTGAGKTAHITTITLISSTYTVTLDDTFTGVTTGTAKARLQAWIKLGEIQNQTQEWGQFPIGVKSPRIQLKCCIISTGKNELFRIALINQPHQELK